MSRLARLESIKRLQAMEKQSDGVTSFAGNLMGCLACGGATGIWCLLCLMGLAIAGLGLTKLVIGSLYVYNCPAEPLIPVFLIVGAIVPAWFNLACRPNKAADGSLLRISCENVRGMFGFVLAAFCFSWLIAGTVWVVRARNAIRSCESDMTAPTTLTTPETDSCPGCKTLLLDFAYAMVIVEWCFTGVFLLMIICILGSFCIAKCITPDEGEV